MDLFARPDASIYATKAHTAAPVDCQDIVAASCCEHLDDHDDFVVVSETRWHTYLLQRSYPGGVGIRSGVSALMWRSMTSFD